VVAMVGVGSYAVVSWGIAEGLSQVEMAELVVYD
jgi:hypothetical protein